jgi:hypothetical protein
MVMMKKFVRTSTLILILFLSACAAPTVSSTPQVVNIYLSSSASAWTNNIYGCASSSTVLKLSDKQNADIVFQIGAPENLSTPSYQIDTEDILVVVDIRSGLNPDALNLDQVRGLFSGQITNWKDVGGADLPVQVWSYAADDDVQKIFEQDVMNGQPITSQARLAASALGMSDSMEAQSGSVGILTRRWKSGNTLEEYAITKIPALAITKSEAQGAVKDLIACLQK